MTKLKACLATLPPGVPKKNRYYSKLYGVNCYKTAFLSKVNISLNNFKLDFDYI